MCIRRLMRAPWSPLPVSPAPRSSSSLHPPRVPRVPCSDPILVGHPTGTMFTYHHHQLRLVADRLLGHSEAAHPRPSFWMSRAIYHHTHLWLPWMWTAHLIIATLLALARPLHVVQRAIKTCYCTILFLNLRFRLRSCALLLPM